MLPIDNECIWLSESSSELISVTLQLSYQPERERSRGVTKKGASLGEHELRLSGANTPVEHYTLPVYRSLNDTAYTFACVPRSKALIMPKGVLEYLPANVT